MFAAVHPPACTWNDLVQRWQLEKNHDLIVYRLSFTDIAQGDVYAGLILAEIVFWHFPNQRGQSKLRALKDGRLWLACSLSEWWERARISKTTAYKALKKLASLSFQGQPLLELQQYRSNMHQGKKVMHIALNREVFAALWEQVTTCPLANPCRASFPEETTSFPEETTSFPEACSYTAFSAATTTALNDSVCAGATHQHLQPPSQEKAEPQKSPTPSAIQEKAPHSPTSAAPLAPMIAALKEVCQPATEARYQEWARKITQQGYTADDVRYTGRPAYVSRVFAWKDGKPDKFTGNQLINHLEHVVEQRQQQQSFYQQLEAADRAHEIPLSSEAIETIRQELRQAQQAHQAAAARQMQCQQAMTTLFRERDYHQPERFAASCLRSLERAKLEVSPEQFAAWLDSGVRLKNADFAMSNDHVLQLQRFCRGE